MKKRAKTRRHIIQAVSILAVTGLFSTAEAQVENYTVQLEVNTAQTELLVTSVGRCSTNNHPGCVQVPKKKTARIQFNLVGNRGCDRSEGSSWALEAVYLGGKNNSGKPGTWGQLDAAVKADFKVANAGSGLLTPERGSSDQKIIITDGNNAEYTIWYKVEASCPGGANIASDPRIINEGK